jgi:serine/threonine protein kinase
VAVASARIMPSGGHNYAPPPTDLALNDICHEYSYSQLKTATSNFSASNRLGQGCYGTVYRGVLLDGTEVAIKALSQPKESGFEEEVQALTKCQHPNIVILLGFARGPKKERYLVYEFLSGGDVRACLEDREDFKWEKRLNCALDAALGLSHLHGSNPQIFHRDVKSQNIILDKYGTAKVADFGLAMLAENNKYSLQVHEKSRPGTLGYADPNYIRSGVVTEKSDVYSAGMVIIELLTGRPPAWNNSAGKIEYITDHIKGLQDVIAMIDRHAEFPYKMVQRVGNLALRAIHEKDRNRPTFVEIVTDLRTWLGDASLRGPALLNPPSNGGKVEQSYCSHVDLSPSHEMLGRISSEQKFGSFFQLANNAAKASTGFVDEDGDSIKFVVEDGKLIRYVNSKKLVGENDSTGIVEILTYQPSRPASVRDQYGWGSEDFPLKVVSELKALADSIGVPNNLPKADVGPAKIDAKQYAHILGAKAVPSGGQTSQVPNRTECDRQVPDALQKKWLQEMSQMFEKIEKENADLRATIGLLEGDKGGNSNFDKGLMARLTKEVERRQELEKGNADLMQCMSATEQRRQELEHGYADLVKCMSASEQRRQELEHAYSDLMECMSSSEQSRQALQQDNADLQKRVQALEAAQGLCRPPETRQMEHVGVGKQTLLQSSAQYQQLQASLNNNSDRLVMDRQEALADAQKAQASLQSQLQDSKYETKQAEEDRNALKVEKELLLRKVRELEEELWLAGTGENGQAPDHASDGWQSQALSYFSDESDDSVQFSTVIKMSSANLLDSPHRQDRIIDRSGSDKKLISKGNGATGMIVNMLSSSVKTTSPSMSDSSPAGAKRIVPKTRRGLLVLQTVEQS